MAITEAAQSNHEQLFPGHISTLKVSDPELIEIFDNWAFDEVIEAGDMDVRLRLMVQLARQFADRPEVRYGLTAMCVGLGQGGSVLWENPHYTGSSK